MVGKIKILQLSPRFPYPTDDGGKIGIANIYSQFSQQGAEVTFFTFDDGSISNEALEQAEKFGKVVLFKHKTKNTTSKILLSLLKNEPLFIFKHRNKKIIKFLKELYLKNKFDVIHVDHSSMMPLGLILKKLKPAILGLRLHNIEWMIWQRYADTFGVRSLELGVRSRELNLLPENRKPKTETPNPKHLMKYFKFKYISRQAKLLQKAESELYKQADICFAITEPDKKRALDLSPGANVIVASAGVNSEEWQPDLTVKKNPYEMILSTTYNWIHNIDAVKWFIEKVMPVIKTEIPEAILSLTGKNPPEWLNKLNGQNLNVLGYVPEVQPYLNRASVYIAPLFVGGGIRIKILEAMAMALPVVATSVSAEGIGAGEDEGLFIADSANDFAAKVVYLLKNDYFRKISGKNAGNFVKREYSWQKNVKIMLDKYFELINY